MRVCGAPAIWGFNTRSLYDSPRRGYRGVPVGSGGADLLMQRIRGRRLVEIRRRFLMEHPLCKTCQGKGMVRAATEVDHIVPLFKGGQDVHENRQGLCDTCHAEKTRKDMGHRDIGCDETGGPTSGSHHWNRI